MTLQQEVRLGFVVLGAVFGLLCAIAFRLAEREPDPFIRARLYRAGRLFMFMAAGVVLVGILYLYP